MNLVITPDNLLFNNIFFNEAIKNTVMSDSSFIRILYSNKDFILNGIYIKINIIKESHHNVSSNSKIITFLEELEKYILNMYNDNKLYSYKIKEQITYLIHKLTGNTHNNIIYILKISGIWETQTTIGLTYKFIPTGEYPACLSVC